MHQGQNHFSIGISYSSGAKHPICQPLEHESQINKMVDYPHNIQRNLVKSSWPSICKQWHLNIFSIVIGVEPIIYFVDWTWNQFTTTSSKSLLASIPCSEIVCLNLHWVYLILLTKSQFPFLMKWNWMFIFTSRKTQFCDLFYATPLVA